MQYLPRGRGSTRWAGAREAAAMAAPAAASAGAQGREEGTGAEAARAAACVVAAALAAAAAEEPGVGHLRRRRRRGRIVRRDLGRSPSQTSQRSLRLQSGMVAFTAVAAFSHVMHFSANLYGLLLRWRQSSPARRPVEGLRRVDAKARRVEDLIGGVVGHHRPREVDKDAAHLAQRVADGRARRLVGEALLVARAVAPRDVLLIREEHVRVRLQRHDVHTAAPRGARVVAVSFEAVRHQPLHTRQSCDAALPAGLHRLGRRLILGVALALRRDREAGSVAIVL